MPILGDRYEYDVFFSYAWGTKSDEPMLGEWSRQVADATTSLLKLRFNQPGVAFRPYLDRDEARSGEDLDACLQQAAQATGVFVAFISKEYNDGYGGREAGWFCDSQNLKGDALADRVCLIKVQDTPEDKWPATFRGSSGKPLLYRDLTDKFGLPISFTKFRLEKVVAGVSDQIEAIALEIADKIAAIAARVKAQEDYRKWQTPPDRPLFFFEAEPGAQVRWVECARDLKKVPSIVLPADAPRPATALSSTDDLQDCDGILMLRSSSDGEFSRRIRSAYLQRRKLFLERKEALPWALLDDLDDPPPEEEVYDIPRVRLAGDWVKNLQMAFRC